MAKPIKPAKVKLFAGIMYRDAKLLDKAIKNLVELYGPVEEGDDKTLEYDFNFTDYYEDETGKNLKKRLVVFKKLVDRDKIVAIKLKTNEIEKKFTANGKRKVNIDPGYLSEHNVVLPSAKERPHRLYIGKGIFGDIVLVFRQKEYQYLPTTFPDYKSDPVRQFLAKTRKTYMEELKKER